VIGARKALLVGCVALTACRATPIASGDAAALQAMIDASFEEAARQYVALDEAVPDTLYPRSLHPDGSLWTSGPGWWTSGFFAGSLWYLYDRTGDEDLRRRALARTRAVEGEKRNAGDHDVGFKVFTSFGHALRATGDSALAPVRLEAAETLATRYDPRVGAIRSWGERSDTTGPYLVIIDHVMNLELLFWAARHGGDPSLFDVAVRHADTTLRNHFRPDGSSWHVVAYDPRTGEVLRKRTQQGQADGSAWARGQAWGLYGFTMAYRETGYARYLEQAKKIAAFLRGNPSLPEDGVPFWDFDAEAIPDAPRDASAGAIMASAFLELSGWVEDSLRTAYRAQAERTLRTLSGPGYRTRGEARGGFLLDHGVGNLPGESEVDVPLAYADHYYLEALTRLEAILRDPGDDPEVVPLGPGWARSSVNAVIFRHHALLSRGGTQYAAWYDPGGAIVLARRAPGEAWETRRTRFHSDVRDAHDAVSLGVDGDGVLHVSWSEHDGALRYVRALAPGSLEMSDPEPMTGEDEDRVTYPQFHELPDGDLLFVYRSGASGDGDVVLNRWDVASGRWRPLAHPLIDGEGRRNAYVEPLVVDASGTWHLAWTWRETRDASTNHDILYARSADEGAHWVRSDGGPYAVPITRETAEVAVAVPQGRDLINQTTMAVDAAGRPHVATYWRPEGSDVPQLHLVWRDASGWRTAQVGERTTPFTLAGGGTRRIPLSRPLVLAGAGGAVHVVFRDAERGGGITLATSTDPQRTDWRLETLWAPSVGQWEPLHDEAAWRSEGALHLLVQRVGQGEGETLEDLPPQPVQILAWQSLEAR